LHKRFNNETPCQISRLSFADSLAQRQDVFRWFLDSELDTYSAMSTMLAFKSDYWLRLKPAFQLAPYSPPTACRSKKTGRSNPSLMPGSKNQTGSEVIERSLHTTE